MGRTHRLLRPPSAVTLVRSVLEYNHGAILQRNGCRWTTPRAVACEWREVRLICCILWKGCLRFESFAADSQSCDVNVCDKQLESRTTDISDYDLNSWSWNVTVVETCLSYLALLLKQKHFVVYYKQSSLIEQTTHLRGRIDIEATWVGKKHFLFSKTIYFST